MSSEKEDPREIEELDLEQAEELESAMREALEAVEGSGRRAVDEITQEPSGVQDEIEGDEAIDIPPEPFGSDAFWRWFDETEG